MKNIYQTILLITLAFGSSFNTFGQVQLNSTDNDVYIMDTLLIDPNQLIELGTLDIEIQKTLSFKSKTDGFKIYHYVTGEIHSKGLIKNKLPEGNWITYHKNGQINKKITFKSGEKHGEYQSWYSNGKPNAKGQLKKGLREGQWVFYKEDGSSRGNYKYKKGKLIE